MHPHGINRAWWQMLVTLNYYQNPFFLDSKGDGFINTTTCMQKPLHLNHLHLRSEQDQAYDPKRSPSSSSCENLKWRITKKFRVKFIICFLQLKQVWSSQVKHKQELQNSGSSSTILCINSPVNCWSSNLIYYACWSLRLPQSPPRPWSPSCISGAPQYSALRPFHSRSPPGALPVRSHSVLLWAATSIVGDILGPLLLSSLFKFYE